VKLESFALLTDENIDPEVVAYFRRAGINVADVLERDWAGKSDVDLIDAALAEQRVIVTHDADFGRLAVLERRKLVGLVYLRSGHIDASFTLGTLDALPAQGMELSPPFILVAKRAGSRISIRHRSLQVPNWLSQCP
jgi:predicted nuclease of predicted toxin-antitoxin system